MLELRNAAIEWLIAADPARSIDGLLDLLLKKTRASGVGVFTVRADAPSLVAGTGAIDQAMLERVRSAWAERRDGLSNGTPARYSAWAVWPLIGKQACHLVYVAGHGDPLRHETVREAVAELGDILSAALRKEALLDHPVIDSYLEDATPLQVMKRQIVAVLVRCEWNYSAAARHLDISRRTLYNWTKRCSIERVRVKKGS